jgi:hypothetical protein
MDLGEAVSIVSLLADWAWYLVGLTQVVGKPSPCEARACPGLPAFWLKDKPWT